jgi:transcriptional regulator of acetoin/glycerol metabolism
MAATPHSTQTWDVLEDAERGRQRPPRLLRFFRADDPLDSAATFPLSAYAAWTIGRFPETRTLAPRGPLIGSCNDALMSTRHATLTATSDHWELDDAASKNGTFVNDKRLTSPHVLVDGDIVQCGCSFFIYRASMIDRRSTGGASSERSIRVAPESLHLSPLDYQIEPVLPFASSDMSLHLHGETGSGKDVVARAIHDVSRRKGAFVARNCAAIPDSLFESELFGYARGAFSGATTSRRGWIVEADGGTLFLDEIGELSLPMQAKLLRVLELKEVLPLGASMPIPVDFRLVSATLCDLEAMVADGRFRRDLYGRLGRTFRIPPLRDHKEHLGRLIRSLLVASSKPPGSLPPVRFKLEAARALVRHTWPLNVRELKHCIESAVAAASTVTRDEDACYVIELHHLPQSVGMAPIEAPALADDEINGRGRPTDDEVVEALRKARGNRAEAAKVLRVSERTIFRWIARLRKNDIAL